ncbi:RNA polymerase-associated protein RapA [Psychrobacter sp.]|uniref:RNA polymerase-associated protein RapA n=1 Tax=Psychrobacter sp. TaxID=56811 RepID=UPI002647F944|nr:RNA polymerase-associated protein RapA [Psychrobacter sp.]MDN6275856.1 RNA polymerase-associated protein RapA [Psychrobacter sp.]MDN6308303.1 RNA polymerase-associated protein RapA [Psychrobacter sp.]
MTTSIASLHSTEFAVGQRYLSDTESELGLGVVIDVDDRCVHILFPQSEETRVYAKNSAPLSRVVFKVGDTVYDQEGNRYTVNAVDEVMGVLKYGVDEHERGIMETRLAANITLAKPLERLLAGRIERGDWYELRQDILRMQSALAGHPLKGLMGARVDIIEHQLYIAHEVGKRIAPRVLLADEVGLGKTIEAGLIIHQQLITSKAERVLILVPDSLQYQWMVELRRRFNLNFALFDLVRTAAIKEHDPEQNVFATEQCIIAGMDLLLDHPDLYDQAMDAGFDLLVVDEAHHLHWDEAQGGNDKYDLIADFAEETPGVMLLTATPEQLGAQSHFARLRLLDPNRFDDLDEFLDGQEAFAETAAVAGVLIEDQPLSEGQITALSHLLDIGMDELAAINDDEKLRTYALNELLDRHGTGRILFRNTRESVKGFYGRSSQPYPLPLPDAWKDSYQVNGKLREQLWGEENQPDGGWLEDDPRVPWLVDILRGELKHQKVLLIARSGATVESLEAVLRLHAGIKTAIFTEQMSLLERDQAAAFFADGEGAQILLCSEIGSEGRNFQFASQLILWDLPANPDTLEQRIGRLDRIGQTQQIMLHIPYVQGTAQERLYHWYDKALNMFNQISPTAQSVQEQYIQELKPVLESADTSENRAVLEGVVEQAGKTRLGLEAQLQAGRDRLLEYNSCRPRVAGRIADAMHDFDSHNLLPNFMDRFFASANIEHSVQRDGSWVIAPIDSTEISEYIDGLPLGDEDGMTLTFERQQALQREDIDFISHEHPLMRAIYDLASTSTFGNTTVAMLKSAAVPQGMVLLEVNFRVEAIAPKMLNLPSTITTQNIRVFISEQGNDLSERISSDMIMPHIERLDKNRARQVIKVRSDVIEQRYHDAEAIARQQLNDIGEQASARFTQQWSREIKRLQHLQTINPNVRPEEIERLEQLKAQGEQALDNLSLVPDSIRVLVSVKP